MELLAPPGRSKQPGCRGDKRDSSPCEPGARLVVESRPPARTRTRPGRPPPRARTAPPAAPGRSKPPRWRRRRPAGRVGRCPPGPAAQCRTPPQAGPPRPRPARSSAPRCPPVRSPDKSQWNRLRWRPAHLCDPKPDDAAQQEEDWSEVGRHGGRTAN